MGVILTLDATVSMAWRVTDGRTAKSAENDAL